MSPTGRRMRRLALVLLALSLLLGCSTPDGDGVPPPSGQQSPPPQTVSQPPGEYASELLVLTNDVRDDEGLPPLEHSQCAEDAALERAEALRGEDELTHAPLAPVIQHCSRYTTAAENLVNSAATPPEVIEAWLGSPGHRANIVDPALTALGIACVPDDAQLLCAQVFLGP